MSRLQVLGLDVDAAVLLDGVALQPAGLDVSRQARQALGVECIVGIEEFAAGLVELGERGGFQLQAGLLHFGGDVRLNAADEVAPLLVQFLHRHLGGDAAQCIDEAAFQQVPHRFGPAGLGAERLRGERDRLGTAGDTDVEHGRDVDPHPVTGDDGGLVLARDLQPVGGHRNRGEVVEHGNDEGAAVLNHLLPAEAGADERDFLGGAAIEPPEQHPQDDDENHDDDDRQDHGGENIHGPAPHSRVMAGARESGHPLRHSMHATSRRPSQYSVYSLAL